MDINTALNKRKSVRSFKDKKVNFRDLIYAIDAANKTPRAGGFYSTRFLIVENPQSIKQIAKLADQSWIAQAPALIIVCSDERNLENLYGERGRIYCRQQAGAAIQNLLLNLTNAGLSGCWVGAFSDELIREVLKIPGHINIEALIPIGYEKPEKVAKAKKRDRPLENTMFWETWDQKRRPSAFEEPGQEAGWPPQKKVKK